MGWRLCTFIITDISDLTSKASSLGWAVLASSHSLWQLVLGRVLTGFCDCLATSGGYMYIAEVSQLLTKLTNS